jgi:outer membrane protein OmpA-like peptidoglycan-associated protein
MTGATAEEVAMLHPRRPGLAALVAATSVSALLAGGSAWAQTVQIFDQAPSLAQLRSIIIPESTGSVTRRIVLPHVGSATASPNVQLSSARTPVATQPGATPAAMQAPSAQVEKIAAGPQAPQSPPAQPPVQAREPERETVAAAQPETTQPEATAAPGVIGFRINFALDSAVIPPSGIAFVERIGELMQQEPQLQLRIEGHTDALGSDAYNLDLSKRRAIAVAKYLVEQDGIAPERLVVAGKGKTEPLMEDPYDPRNRRVQFARVN